MVKQAIHIRGNSCAGKSTTVFTYMQRHGITQEIVVPTTFGDVKCTKGDKTVIVGRYSDKTTTLGGCDSSIKNANQLKAVLTELMADNSVNTVIFEGLLYGKSFKLGAELKKMCEKSGYAYTPISLCSTYETNVQRRLERNGGDVKDEAALYSGYIGNIRANEKLERAGIHVRVVDTAHYKKDEMYKIIEESIREAV